MIQESNESTDSNFSSAFQETEPFKTLQREIDDGAEELERLRQVG